MHPVLFEIFGHPVHGFGLMIALAFGIGFAWGVKRAKAAGLNPEHYLEACTLMLVAGIGGARLMYAVYFPEAFWADPLGMLFGSAGLVWYGGVIGVVLAIFFYTRWRNIPLLAFADVLVPTATLGLAIGRIGCLLAGCCYGAPCDLPWAIQYPAGHATHPHLVHPSPLYETLAMLAATLVLVAVDRHKCWIGQTSAVFLVLYGISRFGLEALRGDRLIWWHLSPEFGLSASQIISFVSILAGVMLWLVTRSRSAAFSK